MSTKYKWIISGSLLAVVIIVLALLPGKAQTPIPAAVAYSGNYVALGDSVAAGVGLANDSDPSACDRTNSSYPFLVAKSYNFKLFNLACSGASANVGILSSQTVNKLGLQPQLDKLFSLPHPKLITLNVGANDVHWNQIITQCYLGDCNQDVTEQTFQADLVSLASNLNIIYGKIAEHYGSAPPALVVTGYYQALPVTSSDCLDVKNLRSPQLMWLRSLGERLNSTLKESVTGYQFAAFIPVDFTGHELCTAQPWVQGLTDRYPYHPSAEGQQVISRAISGTVATLHDKVKQ